MPSDSRHSAFTRFKCWVRGDERAAGPWFMWLGWRYRGEFAFDPCYGRYRHLSFKFFYVDWVPRRARTALSDEKKRHDD